MPVEIARALMDAGATYAARNKKMERPIHMAAKCGNRDVVALLIERGEKVDITTDDHNEITPLMLATRFNQPNTARYLINEANANIFIESTQGFAAIHFAAECNAPEVIKMLLDAGENVNRNMRGVHMTPLHVAVSRKSIASIIMLLSLGANVHARTSMYNGSLTPMDIANEVLKLSPAGVPAIIYILIGKSRKRSRKFPTTITSGRHTSVFLTRF
jgi:ankyrin repeat protein